MRNWPIKSVGCLLLMASAAPAQSPLPIPMQVVTGAPYSGEQVQERVETLTDGSRVTRPLGTAKIYRDSQGRARTERSEAIEINDPVAAVRYTLDPRTKVAHRVSVPRTQIIPGDAPASVLIVLTGTDIRFAQPEPGTPVTAILTATPSGQAGGAQPQITSDNLGTLTMEGVLVEGSRQTWTVSGDDGPIVTVSDTWTSPELKMVILSKMRDPRTGETTIKMTHLSRSEPVPDLFRPPPDYRIVDGAAAP
jgi:hypothetical protein